MLQKRVTIRDLAAKSGLSVATISRYFTRSSSVSSEVGGRIESLAKKLRYRHGPVGRKRLLQREAVGLLVAKKMRPEVVADVVLEEVRDRLGLAAARTGLELVILESYQDWTSDAAEDFFRRRILFEGLRGVFLYGDWDPEGIPAYCRKRLLPLVHLNRGGGTADFVAVDQKQCGFLAADYLLSKGHGSVSIMIPLNAEVASARMEGWRAAHEKHQKVPGSIFDIPTAGMRQGYESMKNILRHGAEKTMPKPGALFCNNDATALGVLRAIGESGFQVPRDVALVGCDDLELAAHAQPSLTTVRQDFGELCEKAMAHMKGILSGEPFESRGRLIEPRLIVRESA